MKRAAPFVRFVSLLLVFAGLTASGRAVNPEVSHAPAGWETGAPRDEIRPQFAFEPQGGVDGAGALVIVADAREGLHGFWTRTFSVKGGQWYRFHVQRRLEGAESPRRSAVVRIKWQDDAGKSVKTDEPMVRDVLASFARTAEPEYPADGATNSEGWTEVTGTYRVPPAATRAVVELHLQWAPNARVAWSGAAFDETSAPAPRIVRLASVHYRPQTRKSPEDNVREFAPLIAEAGRQHADLVVLPETLTFYGTRRKLADCAEPVPGPSTEYFGALAREHNLYIVAGLVERDGALVYNVAALIGPDGKLAGKYRKAALPRGEIEAGLQPGHEFPVFDTRFGKLGLMVCYDGFFPEVARQLAVNGAEVIAWPVWGCNPLLASARACENHVYLVSSTYEDVSSNWMLTAVYDRAGKAIAHAEKFGSVIVAEVDLNQRTLWPSLGDFRAELPHHRPIWENEASPAVGLHHEVAASR